MSSQAASRVARDRLGPLASASREWADGLDACKRVAAEEDIPARLTSDAPSTAREGYPRQEGDDRRARSLLRRRASAGRPFPRNRPSRA
jgi:hypothetical protein